MSHNKFFLHLIEEIKLIQISAKKKLPVFKLIKSSDTYEF